MSLDPRSQKWGPDIALDKLAHGDDKMACYTCHTSWTTSCGGCHLPIQANWKTERHHYEGGETRNFATYNPQVARDDMFLLGRHGPDQGQQDRAGALVIGAGAVVDQHQPRAHLHPAAADRGVGLSARRRSTPHYPHTERKTETKTCTDCHLARNDNNAIMAQLLLHGTNFVNFVGFNAWVGDERQHQRGAGHRVGRAAGGHRQLPAPLRLSRLVRRSREAQETSAGRSGHRARASLSACSCAASTSTWPKARTACASTTSPASATRA